MPIPRTPYPRAWIELEGTPIRWTDLRSLAFEPNVQYQADGLTVVLDNAATLSDWVRKEQRIDLWLGYADSPEHWTKEDLVYVFHGQVDGVLPRFAADRSLTLKARDLSRGLLDTEISETFVNVTSSGVAELLARRHYMAADVVATANEVDGQTFVGKAEWEVLQALAIREGFIAWVDKYVVLHFRPRGDDEPSLGVWTYLEPPYDVLSADLDDSSLVANTVTVVRWLGEDDGLVRGSAVAQDRLTAMKGRVVERVVSSKAAETDEECQTEADGLLATLAREAITGTVTLEGDPRLVGGAKITLAGAALGRFRGDYYIEKATHRLDHSSGYTAELQVTNIRPEASEVYRDNLYADQNEDDLTPAEAGAAIAAAGGSITSSDVGRGSVLTVCGTDWEINFPFNAPYSHPWNPAIPNHRGVDLIVHGMPNNGLGLPVNAFQDGQVTALTYDPAGGNGVIIQMANGLYTAYFHMLSPSPLKSGDPVKRCQQIGVLGQTGTEGNPHVHFEVRKGLNGDPQNALIDPIPFMSGTVPGSVARNAAGGTEPQVIRPDTSSRAATVASIAPLARWWEAKTGIPAEVLIAINIHEGGASVMAAPFGIKGPGTSQQTFEFINGQRVDITDSFRSYSSLNEAYKDFFEFVRGPRYVSVWNSFVAGSIDWKGFLDGLVSKGYATDAQWGSHIASFARNTIRPLLDQAEGRS